MHGVGWHQARGWAEAAAEDGADGVLLLPPTIYRANRAEVLEHYRRVDEVGLPIMAYNNPIDTKVDLTPDLVITDAACRNAAVVAMATGCSTNAVVHLIAMARRAGGRVFTPDLGRLGEYVVADYLRARRGSR